MRSRTVRATLREWWPELLCGGLLVVIGLAGQADDPLFAGFVAVVLAVGFAMGYRHRSLPLHGKVDRMTAAVGDLVDEVRADRDDQADTEPGRPLLRLVKR